MSRFFRYTQDNLFQLLFFFIIIIAHDARINIISLVGCWTSRVSWWKFKFQTIQIHSEYWCVSKWKQKWLTQPFIPANAKWKKNKNNNKIQIFKWTFNKSRTLTIYSAFTENNDEMAKMKTLTNLNRDVTLSCYSMAIHIFASCHVYYSIHNWWVHSVIIFTLLYS